MKNFQSLSEIQEALSKGSVNCQSLVDYYLDRIKKHEDLNIYLEVFTDDALAQAKTVDAKLQTGTAGSLAGMVIALKDNICFEGHKVSASSKILEGFTSLYSATAVERLLEEDAIIIGRLNCDEFAMGSSNETSHYGNVINPVGDPLVPGGSSGGSSSALAADLTPATIGTDTGGSIRQPASFTGTVGLKPTYGRCSRWGIVAFASSLDQAGPMTKNVTDSALLLQAMSGYDPKDSTSVNIKVENYSLKLTDKAKGLKIGIPKEYRVDNMPSEIDKHWKKGVDYLKDAGAIIKNISLPHTKYALPAYYIVAPAEASSNLARYDGVKYGHRSKGNNLFEMYENTRSEGFGDEVKRRILIGTYVLSSGYYDAYYLKAQKVRQLIKNDFDKVFNDVDAILTPSTPSAAFKIGEKKDDPVSMYLNDIFTVPVNLAGLPAISVPAGYDKNNLPLGLQLIGKPFDEQTILNLSLAIEKSANFKRKINVWWK